MRQKWNENSTGWVVDVVLNARFMSCMDVCQNERKQAMIEEVARLPYQKHFLTVSPIFGGNPRHKKNIR